MSSEQQLPANQIYNVLEQQDERQIAAADSAVRQALAYDVPNKGKQISYAGVKWIVLKMSQKGQTLKMSEPEIRLDKDIPDEPTRWYWRSTVKVHNDATGFDSYGVSEQAYMDSKTGVYDNFGRVKASSKAIRNAYRAQIPELEIQSMLQAADDSQIETIKSGGSTSASKAKGVIRKIDTTPDKKLGEPCKCETPTPRNKVSSGAMKGYVVCKQCKRLIPHSQDWEIDEE